MFYLTRPAYVLPWLWPAPERWSSAGVPPHSSPSDGKSVHHHSRSQSCRRHPRWWLLWPSLSCRDMCGPSQPGSWETEEFDSMQKCHQNNLVKLATFTLVRLLDLICQGNLTITRIVSWWKLLNCNNRRSVLPYNVKRFICSQFDLFFRNTCSMTTAHCSGQTTSADNPWCNSSTWTPILCMCHQQEWEWGSWAPTSQPPKATRQIWRSLRKKWNYY